MLTQAFSCEVDNGSVQTRLSLLSVSSPGCVFNAAGLPVATPDVSALIKRAPAGGLPRVGPSAGHRWHTARLEAPGAGTGEVNQRDVGTGLGPSWEKSPPLANDSPSKWRQSYSPSGERLANVPGRGKGGVMRNGKKG